MPPWRRLRGLFGCFSGRPDLSERQTEEARYGASHLPYNQADVTHGRTAVALALGTDTEELGHLGDDVNPATLRDSMICNVSPAILTVFSLETKRVLHQNLNSLRYMGSRVSGNSRWISGAVEGAIYRHGRGRGGGGGGGGGGHGARGASRNAGPVPALPTSPVKAERQGAEGQDAMRSIAGEVEVEDEEGRGPGGNLSLLEHIFFLDHIKFERMVADLKDGCEGRVWRGVVRVPPSLVGIHAMGHERDGFRIHDRIPDPRAILESEELLFLGSCTGVDETCTFTTGADGGRMKMKVVAAAAAGGGTGEGHGAMIKGSGRLLAVGSGGGAGGCDSSPVRAFDSFSRTLVAQSSTTTTNRSFAGVPAPHTPRHTNTNINTNTNTSNTTSTFQRLPLTPSNVDGGGGGGCSGGGGGASSTLCGVVSGGGGGGSGIRSSSRQLLERGLSGNSNVHFAVAPGSASAAAAAAAAAATGEASGTSLISPNSSHGPANDTTSQSAGANSSLLRHINSLPPPQQQQQQRQQQQEQQEQQQQDVKLSKRASSLGALTGSSILGAANTVRRLMRTHRGDSRKVLNHTQINASGHCSGHSYSQGQSRASLGSAAIQLHSASSAFTIATTGVSTALEPLSSFPSQKSAPRLTTTLQHLFGQGQVQGQGQGQGLPQAQTQQQSRRQQLQSHQQQQQQQEQQQPASLLLDDSGQPLQHLRQRSRGKSMGSRPPILNSNRSRLSLLGVAVDGEPSPNAVAATTVAGGGGGGRSRPQSAHFGIASGGGGQPSSMDSGVMRAMCLVESVLSSGSGVEPPALGDPLATSTFNIALPPSMLPGYTRRKPLKRCTSACDLNAGLRGRPPSTSAMTSTSRAVAFASTLRNAPMAPQLYGASGGTPPATSTVMAPPTVPTPHGQHQMLGPMFRSDATIACHTISVAGSMPRLASGGSGAIGGTGGAGGGNATDAAASVCAYRVSSRAVTLQGYGLQRTGVTVPSIMRRSFHSPTVTGTVSAVLPSTGPVPLATDDSNKEAGLPSSTRDAPDLNLLTDANSGPRQIAALWHTTPLGGENSTAMQVHTSTSHGQTHTHNPAQKSISNGMADCIDPWGGFSHVSMDTSTIFSPFCAATAPAVASGTHGEASTSETAVPVVTGTDVAAVMSSSRGERPIPQEGIAAAAAAAVMVSEADTSPDGEALGAIAFLTTSENSYYSAVPGLVSGAAACDDRATAAAAKCVSGHTSNQSQMAGTATQTLPLTSASRCDTLGIAASDACREDPGFSTTVPNNPLYEFDSKSPCPRPPRPEQVMIAGATTLPAWREHLASQRAAGVASSGGAASNGFTYKAGGDGGGGNTSNGSFVSLDNRTRSSGSCRSGEQSSIVARTATAAAAAAGATHLPQKDPDSSSKGMATLLPHLLCSNLSTVRETQSVAVSETTDGFVVESAVAIAAIAAAAAAPASGGGLFHRSSSLASDRVATATEIDVASANAQEVRTSAAIDSDRSGAGRCAAQTGFGAEAPVIAVPAARAAAGSFSSSHLQPQLQLQIPPPSPSDGAPEGEVLLQRLSPAKPQTLLTSNASTAALLTVLGPNPYSGHCPPLVMGRRHDDGTARAAPLRAEEGSPPGVPATPPSTVTTVAAAATAAAAAMMEPHTVSASESMPECWHEIWASRAVDPVTGEAVLVLAQHDVTAKVIAERHLALVMETEHRLLEQLFPRHILAYITEEWTCEALRAAIAPPQSDGTFPQPSNSQLMRPTVRDCTALATWHEQVTLLFADIKGFTPMCKQVEPRAVMSMLNDLYSRYDKMLDTYGVFKVETIGDCYFVAGGLMHEDEDGMVAVRGEGTRQDPLHARKVFMFAKAMLEAAKQVALPTTGEPVQIRIGIATGPVVSGVVGQRMPRFCLFGDTVNTASRMESTGVPGAIHVSQSTYEFLRDEAWIPTGGIEVKGKGLMQTYLWRDALEADLMNSDMAAAVAVAAAAAAVVPGLRSSTAVGKTPSQTVQKIAQVSSSVAQLQDLLLGSVAERAAGIGAGIGISDQGLCIPIAEGLLQHVTAGLGGASTYSDCHTTTTTNTTTFVAAGGGIGGIISGGGVGDGGMEDAADAVAGDIG